MRRFVLGTVKKYNHSADGQAPYGGAGEGPQERQANECLTPQKLSQVGVRGREEQVRGWREFGEAGNSPDLNVISPCVCNFQTPL